MADGIGTRIDELRELSPAEAPMQRFRIKATDANGATCLGDYMAPEVWVKHFWPAQQKKEAQSATIPRLSLVPVDASGAEIPDPEKGAAWAAWAVSPVACDSLDATERRARPEDGGPRAR